MSAGDRRDIFGGVAVLNEVITAQRDLYRSLVHVASDEQGAIVAGDIERLTELVERKEELLDHLRALETERMTALVAIEMATGIAAETATLAEIGSRLPSEAAAALDRVGRELKAEALALEEMHATNAHLLRNSRSLVDRWIQYLRSALAGSMYTSGGTGGQTSLGGRALDKSA